MASLANTDQPISFIDQLRYQKHSFRRKVGWGFLRVAANFPRRTLISAMRRRLGIQLNPDEIIQICQAIHKHSRPNVLIFGTGKDSEFWYRTNRSGTTVFVEDDLHWVEQARLQVPHLDIRPIVYETRLSQWTTLLGDDERLAQGTPDHLADRNWDVILVDAPRGDGEQQPGRMKSIYFASQLAQSDTDVFVHDCDRIVESSYCDHYLGSGKLVGKFGRLRHYRNVTSLQTATSIKS